MSESKPLSPEEVKAACKEAAPETKVIKQTLYKAFIFFKLKLLHELMSSGIPLPANNVPNQGSQSQS